MTHYPEYECNCVLPSQSCPVCRYQARLVYGPVYLPLRSSFTDEAGPGIRYDDWGEWDYNDYDLPPLEGD